MSTTTSASATASAFGATRALRWIAHGDRVWRLLSWFGLFVLLAFVAAFGTDAGISYDEHAQLRYGDMVLAWFRSGFTDMRATEYYDLYFYGGLFDLVAQWIVERSSIGVFETRHIVYAVVGVIGVASSWLMAARVAGPRAGFFGALFLALTPTWVGHALMNPKDIPFGAAAAFVGVASLRLAMGPAPVRMRDAVLAGLAVGIALSARPGGIFVFGYPCLAAGLRLALELQRRRRTGQPLAILRTAGNLALCVALVVLVAWPVMLAAWPWAQLDPIDHPLEAMRVARKFNWTAPMKWDAKIVHAHETPLSYLPLWFNVTLPEIYLLASVAGAAVLGVTARQRKWIGERVLGLAILASLVLVPLAAVFVARPVLYDAHRHFLFLLPPFAALAGIALSEAVFGPWLPRLARGSVAAVFVAGSLLVAIDTVQLHPYQYVYFNRSSGGLRKQVKRYETDYWGVSYKEGTEWVVRNVEKVHPKRRTRLAGCDFAANERIAYYLEQWGVADKFQVVRRERADIFLAVRRFDCHRENQGPVLHVVRRQGAPLMFIERWKRR